LPNGSGGSLLRVQQAKDLSMTDVGLSRDEKAGNFGFLSEMPRFILVGLLVVCFAPLLLNVLGVDFSSTIQRFDIDALSAENLSYAALVDRMFYALAGGLQHGFLEWSSVGIATITVLLTFVHYRINHDITVPIIGLALLSSGLMDAFHTLAATRLITAVAENSNLIPFTWALSRGFHAVILIAGALIVLALTRASGKGALVDAKKGLRWLFGISVVFVGVGYFLIYLSATSEVLPRTQFPNALITRPYDVVPLVLFILAAPLFWTLYKRSRTLFTAALVLGLLPEVVLEAHMAFGSSVLFDNHFNIAHFLKIVAYTVPFIGLLIDYVNTYQSKEREVAERQQIEAALLVNMRELEQTNLDLDKFAYIASHDLKAPLRGIEHLATWIKEDIADPKATAGHLLMMSQRISRMEKLLDDLLRYSRIGRTKMEVTTVGTTMLVQKLFEMASPPSAFKLKIVGSLPTFKTHEVPFELVLRNLINNAIKHHDRADGVITISAAEEDDFFEFRVQDDGPGIKSEFFGKIFEVFQTLRPRDEVEGSGVGLAMVKKAAQVYGGGVRVQSEEGAGSSFFVRWPKQARDVQVADA
jgi:signal transduction histidine kinase